MIKLITFLPVILANICPNLQDSYELKGCCDDTSSPPVLDSKIGEDGANHQSANGIFSIAKALGGNVVAQNLAPEQDRASLSSWWGQLVQDEDAVYTCNANHVVSVSKTTGLSHTFEFDGSACKSTPVLADGFLFVGTNSKMANKVNQTITKLNPSNGEVVQQISADTLLGLTSIQTDYHWILRGPWVGHKVANDAVCGDSSRMYIGLASYQYANGVVHSTSPQLRAGGYYYQKDYNGRLSCFCANDMSKPCWDLTYHDGVKRSYWQNGFPYLLPDLSSAYTLPSERINEGRSKYAGSVGHIADCDQSLVRSADRLIFNSINFTYTGTQPAAGSILALPRTTTHVKAYLWTQAGIDTEVSNGSPANFTSAGNF